MVATPNVSTSPNEKVVVAPVTPPRARTTPPPAMGEPSAVSVQLAVVRRPRLVAVVPALIT